MITVNIYYTGKAGSASRFAEEMERTGTADRIRKEEGNIQYEYFFPKNDPETVLLIDKWENQEALDKHHASPMMQTIMDLRGKYNLQIRAERFISEDFPETDAEYLQTEPEKEDGEEEKVDLEKFHRRRMILFLMLGITIFLLLIGGFTFTKTKVFLLIGMVMLMVTMFYGLLSGAESCPYCGEMLGRRGFGGEYCKHCGRKIF